MGFAGDVAELRTERHIPQQKATTLMLALGNPLRGDDGAGAAVLEGLRRRTGVADRVDLLDGGTAGLETILLMQGYTRVVIVDAARMGKEAGEWVRFTPAEVRLDAGDEWSYGTVHDAGLAEALSLGEALGVLPQEIVIIGIEPQSIGWEPGLSPVVLTAVEDVCRALETEILA
jgi:hydrogenase maturation protease